MPGLHCVVYPGLVHAHQLPQDKKCIFLAVKTRPLPSIGEVTEHCGGPEAKNRMLGLLPHAVINGKGMKGRAG